MWTQFSIPGSSSDLELGNGRQMCSGGRYYRYGIDTFDIWIQFHSIDIGNETQKLSIDTSAVNVQRK